VFENRALRRIFGPKMDEVTGDWRKLHNDDYNLYFLPSVIKMTKSRRIGWAGHVARLGRRGMRIGYWWESQKEKDHNEGIYVGGRMILKWRNRMG
jgi:hypothetical protein